MECFKKLNWTWAFVQTFLSNFSRISDKFFWHNLRNTSASHRGCWNLMSAKQVCFSIEEITKKFSSLRDRGENALNRFDFCNFCRQFIFCWDLMDTFSFIEKSLKAKCLVVTTDRFLRRRLKRIWQSLVMQNLSRRRRKNIHTIYLHI